MRHSTTLIAAAVVPLLAACSDGPKQVVAPPLCEASAATLAQAGRVPDASPFDSIFASVGAAVGVPVNVLRAVAYVETRWQMVEGHEEFRGMAAAHGVMALRGARLADAARLAGLTEAAVRRDPAANIRAGAALLRAYADSLGVHGDDAGAWAPAIARYSGIELAAGQQSYLRDVAAVEGGRRSAPETPAHSQSGAEPCGPPPPPTTTDHSGAVWRSSPNFNQRTSGDGGRVHIVIIHSCEGGYAGCWSWLANAASQVSAHYVIREDGAEITQLVRESSRAWHIGATYDSTLNAGHAGNLHGTQSNHFTVGVEHAGYASQVFWPAAQVEASARLVCDIARRWQVPRDRLHIVSHGQLQPWNRTDPGAGWPWSDYMARIERHCTA